jgi:hypothetical protein
VFRVPLTSTNGERLCQGNQCGHQAFLMNAFAKAINAAIKPFWLADALSCRHPLISVTI